MSPSKRKSKRDEMTISSDEDNTKKLHSKDKYYNSSDIPKRIEKNKKSKKARKNYSESSSESDGGYDSRKENKTARKHKKTSSKERYEKEKHLEKSAKAKYQDSKEKPEKDRSFKVDRNDVSQKRDSQNSGKRKRSRSQERQRYGKWTDTVDTEKEKSSTIMYDNTETHKKSSKRRKKSKSTERHSKDKNKYDSYSEENDEDSHKIDKAEYNRKDKSDKRIKDKDSFERYHRESDENSHRTRETEYVKKDRSSDKRGQDKSKYDRYGRESDEDSRRMSRKTYDHSKSYEKHSNKKDASDQHDRNKSRLENVEERTKNPYRKDVYENRHQNNENTHKERDFHSRKKMPRPPYVDLDDPDRRDEESKIDEDANNKSIDKEVNSKKDDVEPLSKKEKIVNINMRTGGAYIPPAKLRMMQERIKDKASEEYQRIAWEALKKSIVGMTNKVNSSNISEIVFELFKENIIRGRGVLARAIMQAQGASVTFTRVYAALVAVINTKFPEIGELILKRLVIQYRRGFRRNDKTVCLTAARFLAHLLNQEVAHEVLILEILTHLLENPTEDSVEIAILTLKECGKKLTKLTARGMRAITQRVREVLHEGNIDARVRYMIEVFFAVQKDGFKDFEIIPEELDLVEDADKNTHFINLDDTLDNQEMLNVFKFDPNYVENEEKYKSVAKEILGDSDDEEGGESGEESDSEGEDDENEKKEESQQIIDMTDTNIVCLRRKIYLTIQSSLGYEECAHKLLKLELKPGQILEMCYMILDCCAQQRTYEKLFGLLAQRFCQLNKIYVEPFTEIFENSYKTIHRLETNKLRNVAKFFAHLLYTDAISWNVLSIIKLNEEDTSSSSRIFIKILFQELCEYMGLPKLNERVKDVTLQEAFDGLFPRDDPHNTRFAINFFTSIGLGGLTDELREHLKNLPKNFSLPAVTEKKASSVSASSSSASSSSSTSSSSSSSSSSDSE